MATRIFKRDARGRFASTDSRKKKGFTPAEKEALAANESYREAVEAGKIRAADEAVLIAEKAEKDAMRAFKRLQRVGGGDAAHEAVADQMLKAKLRLAKAWRARAKFR